MTEHVVAGSLSMEFLVRASVFLGTRNGGACGKKSLRRPGGPGNVCKVGRAGMR